MTTNVGQRYKKMNNISWPCLRGHPRLLAACLALALPLALPARAGDVERVVVQPDELADLSIEELANIQVTSVSKRPERLRNAAASVFLITADDIRRSGADTCRKCCAWRPTCTWRA